MSGLKYVWSKICPILFTGLKYVGFINWSKICQSKRCRSKRCQSKRCRGTDKFVPPKSGDGTIDIPSSVFYVYHPAAPGSNPDGTHYLCFSRGLKRKTIGQPTVLLIV